MKKYLLLLICSIVLSSCHRVEIPQNEWVYTLDEAKQLAQKSDKKIFLLFSAESDGYSPKLKENIFFTEEFKKKFSDDYVFLNLDFTESIAASKNEENSSIKKELSEPEYFSSLIGLQYLPAFYVLSKEGYLVANIFFHSEFKTVDEFKVVFEQYIPQFDLFENLMENLEKSSGLDRARAIDALFKNTEEGGRVLLYPLFSEIISLDPKNETGLVGNYIVACANRRAVEYSLKGDIESASNEFLKIYDTAIFTTEEKQSCLSMVVVILSNTENPDYERIVSYLNQIHDLGPNTQLGMKAAKFVANIKKQFDNKN